MPLNTGTFGGRTKVLTTNVLYIIFLQFSSAFMGMYVAFVRSFKLIANFEKGFYPASSSMSKHI